MKPNYTCFTDESGNIIEEYSCNGLLHREDGPARIESLLDGTVLETYCVNGKKHRTCGPAELGKSPDGKTIGLYYINGIQVNPPSRPLYKNIFCICVCI